MYCPHCNKKIPRTASTCPFCAQPTHTPTAGMATLRVSCRPRGARWTMIAFIGYLQGYKVFISVDNQNYVLKSKKKQIDIPVSVGTHEVRISSVSKKSAKAMSIAGKLMVFSGAVTDSSSAVYAGAALEDLGAFFSDKGIKVSFEENELVAIPVKQAWNLSIVEDKEE